MHATLKLTAVEAKLFLRDRASAFWGLVFPALLLAVLGAFFPGFLDPNPDVGGARLIDLYTPIVLAVSLATIGIATVPVVLAGYRQFGVLRRLALTPMSPRRLLIAQLTVQVTAAILAAVVALVVAVAAFDVPLPANPWGFALVFVLAAICLFAIGLLVGALVPTASAAQAIAMLLYFPMLFFGGLWFPRAAMPEGLRTVSDLTPIGAAVQAFEDTWAGAAPAASSLMVMAAFVVIVLVPAIKLFRWQ